MSDVDLSALKREDSAPPRRPLGPRLALAALVLVVLGVAASFVVPLLRPVRGVLTAAVQAATPESASARAATAEAAGWIEPDPFPIVVRPLVAGILETLPVLEGDAVEAGETVVGRMRSAALEAAHDRAAAQLALAEQDLQRRRVELEVAESLLEQKADLRLKETTARHDAAALKARLEARRKEHEEAREERAARRAELEGQERLAAAGGTYPVALARARAAVRAADARVAAKAKDVEALVVELAKAEATLVIVREVLSDPRALQGAVDNARANVAHLAAERDSVKVELDIAKRELGWATITSPVDGIVLKLLAAPGARIGPQGEGVVSLYDPERLQARVDVPLGAVAGVQVGQEVEIRSEVLGNRSARGRVLRVQRESDLLKNTLQVKVRLCGPRPWSGRASSRRPASRGRRAVRRCSGFRAGPSAAARCSSWIRAPAGPGAWPSRRWARTAMPCSCAASCRPPSASSSTRWRTAIA
jgi:multidrug efflux pump subunit AcrA (membrane-fusion protein)